MSKKINWGYFRNGGTSCKRAQEVLDAGNIYVQNRVIANKEKIDSKAAWAMLKSASLIRTGKGKKTNVWNQ